MDYSYNTYSTLASRDAINRSLQTSLLDIQGASNVEARRFASRSLLSSTLARATVPSSFGTAAPSVESLLQGRPNSVLSQSLGVSSYLLGDFRSAGLPGDSQLASLLLAKARADMILIKAKAAVLQETIASQPNDQALQEEYIKHLKSQDIATKAYSVSRPMLSQPLLSPHIAESLSVTHGGPSAALLSGSILPLSRSAPTKSLDLELVSALRGPRAAVVEGAVRAGFPAVETKPKMTLKALGASLRTRSDPFIDCLDIEDPDECVPTLSRGGVNEPFPDRLHRMLLEVEREGNADVVCFLPHGRAFVVLDEEKFVKEVLPKYFKQSKWLSFTRQLNLYGFLRMASGPDVGAYYHELFLKSRPSLCKYMRRVGVPTQQDPQRDRRKCRPRKVADLGEPDFYRMRPSAPAEASRQEERGAHNP
jgi:hypothetical protein